MKSLIKLLILLIFFSCGLNSETPEEKDFKNCVWKYKCCKYQNVNGTISCSEVCDPEINCDLVGVVENKQSEEHQDISIASAGFRRSFRPKPNPCKPGHRLDSGGTCRKILK